MTDFHPKRTKLRGIVRAEFERLDTMLRSGFTSEAVVQVLERETGLAIKVPSFRNAMSMIRHERRDPQNMRIVQATPPSPERAPALTPAPTATPAPTIQIPQPKRASPAFEPLSNPARTAPPDASPLTGEEKKRRLAEATRAPIPNLEKYLPKPGRHRG